MVNKKLIAVLLCVFMVIGNLPVFQTKAGAEADIRPPELISISIDKKSVVAGDKVKVTVKATDNGGSGIKQINIWYRAPITGTEQSIYFKMVQEGVYEGSLTLTAQDESGIYKITKIIIEDNVDLSTWINNSNITGVTPNQDFSNCDFELTGTSADVTPPVLKSISIDKTSASVGDSIKITLNATDNNGVGIAYMSLNYKTPITSKGKQVKLEKVKEGIYEGYLTFTDFDESGTWKVYDVFLKDYNGNHVYVRNSCLGNGIPNMDMSNCDFELTGTTGDVTPPVLNSISIDKKSIVVGDSIKITALATDNGGSGIENIQLNYISPITHNVKLVQLKMVRDGIYEGILSFTDVDELGKWKLSTVRLNDNLYNNIMIYDSNIWDRTPNQDFSNCIFELKENPVKPIPQTYVTKNETWNYKVIEGDLYIGPDAVLTIDGPVTVNGNIYVFGTLKSLGTLTVRNSIYGKNFKAYEIANGAVIFWRGTNNTYSSLKSIDTYPIKAPLKIYEANNKTISVVGNMLNVTGALVPLVDLYVDGTKVNYLNDGTFSMQIDITNKDSVTFKTVDVFGYKNPNTYYLLKVNEPIATHVSGVTLDKSNATLEVYRTMKLSPSVMPFNASIKDVIFSSGDEKVARVDSSGTVTGIAPGSTDITVTTVDGRYTAICKVTVLKPNITVTLNKTTATINKGANLQLKATVLPEQLTNKNVTWSSSNPSVAVVDKTGLVTAVEKGTAVITATTVDGGKTAKCTVTVTGNSIINKIRYGGANRFDTAVKVSKAGWTTSENVVLVNAYGFPDALTGVPFAHLKNAPILLTDPGSLTAITKDEIVRLKAKNIYILGGTSVVSKAIEDNLKSRGYNVYRIAGSGRFETAIAIGNKVIGSSGSKTAVLTTAYNYPDALAISSYAAINKMPILYTDPAKFTESTKAFIIKNGITKVIIPGGTGAVSSGIEKDLKSRGIMVQRISGADRYSTAYNIVNTFKSSFKNNVMLATGKNFPDALAGGVLAAKLQIPILLVQQNSIDANSAAYIRSKGTINLYILGGSKVISDSIIK